MAGIPRRKEITKQRIVFLVGPTAVGKTEVAAILAKKINTEVISCDSMQVYRGMDILTSKPTPALRKKVKHHLIDILSPQQEYNVSRYHKEASKKIGEILAKGKVPLVVGGTGLYMSILINGIFQIKSEDKGLRLRLAQEAKKHGGTFLYKKLKQVDPQAASKIHPNDAKRIIRALEVFLSTGKQISRLQKERKGLSQDYDLKIFCLNIERNKLYRRIEARVEKMFKSGLVAEVKRLLKLRLSKTSRWAIGVREVKGYLEGLYDLEEAKRQIKRSSCLYAKRQLTWFRQDKRIKWIEVADKETPASIANRIGTVLKTKQNCPLIRGQF
ncbi:MAG: tRNA (adenosine(37)-N6)-dimethylallyltransferase MiaA [Candidatus Omnitrophica bacterium]|nr:tRNA (adenosine(37)-N6)-dimethylallyltransferase MiaA [Candidatus Omnitrophota bacterium]